MTYFSRWKGRVILSNMGSTCKIFEKDGWLFETHSFTNSTSGEENLQKLREIIAKKKTKILGIQDQFELHKQSLLEDREKMKKEIEALKQQSQYEVKRSVRRVIEFLLGGGVLYVLRGNFLGTKM